jgi:hypothetical protein
MIVDFGQPVQGRGGLTTGEFEVIECGVPFREVPEIAATPLLPATSIGMAA